MCSSKKDFAKGALFGAAIGALLGLLNAPASGEETRKKIKKTSEKYLDEGKAKFEELKEEGQTKVEELKEEAEIKAEEIKEKVHEAVEEVLDETTSKKGKSSRKQRFEGTK